MAIMAEDDAVKRRAVVSRPLDVEPFDPLSAAVALEIAAVSVCGRLRPHNTDHYLAIRLSRGLETLVTSLAKADRPNGFEEYGYAMFVADGIGSQGEGARASRAALSALAYLAIHYGKWNVRADPDTAADIRKQIQFFYSRADHTLRQASLEFPGASLTTSLTMVAVAGADLFFANVGHSKAFLFRAGGLIQLTTNHRLKQERFETRRPSALEHAKRDLNHVMTKTVGGGPGQAAVDIEHTQLVSSDRLLLCTNGLTDVVSEDEIADALALRRRPADDCQQLVDLAVSGGSNDDVTAMVADYRLRSTLWNDPNASG
jgi:protein phosphatase